MALYGAITDVQGIKVGHCHDLDTLTGCTVILCGDGATVGVEVRGGAPATRETDACRSGTLVEKAHAVVLSGGSAFGLEAACGVTQFLREQGLGFPTGVIPVPIVPAACLFDLGLGSIAWPDADDGRKACIDATDAPPSQGCVGAGTGATVGKLLGLSHATKAGIGTSSTRVGEVTIGAMVAVNAVGNVMRPRTNTIIAGARAPESGQFVDLQTISPESDAVADSVPMNTTIGVVATDALLNSEQCNRLAAMAHIGLVNTIRPVHTLRDGDTMFALATGSVTLDWHRWAVALEVAVIGVVENAIISAIENAVPMGGLPAYPTLVSGAYQE